MTCCFVFDSTKMGLFCRDGNSPVKLLHLYKNTEFGSALSFDLSSWEPSMSGKKGKNIELV